MTNEGFETPANDLDPLVESLGFVGFDSIDLLRFVESEMDAEEEAVFLEHVRSADSAAARRLFKMRRDHDAMLRVPEAVPGRDLLASVRSRIARGELIEDQLFADAGLEPTDLMSKSIEALARRRRRDRRRPFEWAAAGIAVAMFAGVLGSRLIDRISSDDTGTVALDERTMDAGEVRASPARSDLASVSGGESRRPDRASEPTVLTTGGDRNPAAAIENEFEPGSSLASFGLAVVGDGGEAFEVRLASLVLDSNAVLIRNLTLAESISGNGNQARAEVGLPAGGSTSSRVRRGSLQPPPIVGMSDDLPNSRIRIDLAERGFRYAIVVPRAEVDGVLSRLSGLAKGSDGARLIPAVTGRPTEAFDSDAWSSWSDQARSRPLDGARSESLIVPIAVVAGD
ncbi:MAG: hypothetical protein P8J59_04125 [Phycisphaerales bacterium]|nr:hypothetical protein [Phycisphaerales bacterium]